MKRFAFAAVALIVLSGTTFAGPQDTLTSASVVTLQTLAPELDVSNLTPTQVSHINNEVASDNGISRSDLLTLIER